MDAEIAWTQRMRLVAVNTKKKASSWGHQDNFTCQEGEVAFFTHEVGEVVFLENFHPPPWISNGAPLKCFSLRIMPNVIFVKVRLMMPERYNVHQS